MNNKGIAIFGAGCFWGVEEEFYQTPGVLDTEVGYSGGKTTNPTYQDVCSGETGHAEVVRIEYDPDQISYEKLLDKFWDIHDPTLLDQQGADIGDQYRSVIFYIDEEQKRKAIEFKKRMERLGKFKGKIMTDIEPAKEFYPAEEYHQKYLEKRKANNC